MQDDIVIGLLFGDEGKGTTVDYLAHQKTPNAVIRFSGGPQTAHNVITPDGKHHTFAQFGSATFQRIPTLITSTMLVNPFNLIKEGELIYEKTNWNPFPSLNISENSLLITPFHVWLNRKREDKRNKKAHGSCGEGIGETRFYHKLHPQDALHVKDLLTGEYLNKMRKLKEYVEGEAGETCPISVTTVAENYRNIILDDFLNIVTDDQCLQIISDGYCIFEGSQGILLDELYGFYPHTTWSSVTAENAQKLLVAAGKTPGKVNGIIRSYMTRHGHGPFPTEIPNTTHHVELYPENHNQYGEYQGGWRRGHLDLPMLQYAIQANQGIDNLILTHADKVTGETKVVTEYTQNVLKTPDFYAQVPLKNNTNTIEDDLILATEELNQLTLEDTNMVSSPSITELMNQVEQSTGVPVSVLSYGPTWEDKKSVN